MSRDELEREMAGVRYGRSQGYPAKNHTARGEKVIDLDAIDKAGMDAGPPREMCDHICLLPATHVDEGTPHFYGYDSRTRQKPTRADLLALLDEAVGLIREAVAMLMADDVYYPDAMVEHARLWLARFPTPSPTDEEG